MNKINYTSHNWLAIKINNRIINSQIEAGNIHGVVYDLGCGEKPYEKDILKKADKYFGVDWSETLHDLKADIVADLNVNLPIDSEIADTIVSCQVLEHLREPQFFLNECYRILKNEGSIIITVPFQWWIHESPYDYFRYTKYGLQYMLEKAGFKNYEIRPTSGFFTMLVLKINYFSARFVLSSNYFKLFRFLLMPIWFLGQLIAPLLDKFDERWESETISYIVVAKKNLK